MPTSKKRINLSLPEELEDAVYLLAKRDKVPQATKVVQLLKVALELEEDLIWARLASERGNSNAVYIPHEDAWK